MKHNEGRMGTISATVPVSDISDPHPHKPDHRMVETWEVRIAVLEERVRMQEKNVHDTFLARNDAIIKAASAVDRRLDGMNEFREQLRTQQSTFLTKTEYDYHHEALVDRVNKNGEVLTALQVAKTNWATAWMIIGGIISALASVIAVIAVLYRFKG